MEDNYFGDLSMLNRLIRQQKKFFFAFFLLVLSMPLNANQQTSFDDWVAALRTEARKTGISEK